MNIINVVTAQELKEAPLVPITFNRLDLVGLYLMIASSIEELPEVAESLGYTPEALEALLNLNKTIANSFDLVVQAPETVKERQEKFKDLIAGLGSTVLEFAMTKQ